jgi:hypothetical protein
VVEDLGLARLGLGDERVVENVENILADLLELRLDLLSVVADGANVLLGALRLLLLLDRGDDSPRRTSRADHVLVGNGQKIALVDGQFTTELFKVISCPGRDMLVVARCAQDQTDGRKHTLATSCKIVSL